MKRTLVTASLVLALAAAATAQQADGLTAFERARQEAQILKQQSTAQVHALLAQVPELVAAERYVDADIKLRTAKRIVSAGRHLSLDEKAALMADVDRLDQLLTDKKTAYLAVREEKLTQEVAAREAQRRESREAMDQRRQEAHWSRLKEMKDERKYDLALDEAKALLERNANDEQARRVADQLRYLADSAQGYAVRISRYQEFRKVMRDTEESAVPYHGFVHYPDAKTWEALTNRRFMGLLRDQGVTTQSLQSLDALQKRVNIEMQDATLKNALLFLSDSAGVPIAVDPHLQADTGKSVEDEVITVNVKMISLEQALNMILPEEMGWRQEEGQIIVSSREKANPLKVRSYPIRDLVAEVPDFGKTAPRMNLGTAIEQGGDSGSGGIFDDDDDDDDTGPPAYERIIELVKRFVTSGDPRVADW
ncbi:MAG: hypothetical protein JXL80_17190, partial [Planctomycetes bacterium]|nr:hypothetical protein [Planctomycetota bacterium]